MQAGHNRVGGGIMGEDSPPLLPVSFREIEKCCIKKA